MRPPRLNAGKSGGLAEWSKAAVLKTVEPRGSRGSNPGPPPFIKKPSLWRFFYESRSAALA